MNEIYQTTILSPDLTRLLLAAALASAVLGILLVEQTALSRFLSYFGLGARPPKL